MNRGQKNALAASLFPKIELPRKAPPRLVVSIRNQELWDNTQKACQDPKKRNLFFIQDDNKSKEAAESRNKARELCRLCPVRNECFELSLLTVISGSPAFMSAGVTGTEIRNFAKAIGGSSYNRLVGSMHPENPVRQAYFEASKLLLHAIDGNITPEKAIEQSARYQRPAS